MDNILLYAVLAVVPSIWYLYLLVKQWRFNKYAHIPQHLPNSLLFGHLNAISETYKKMGDNRLHIDYILEKMHEEAGRPEMMFIDMRPFMYPMLVVASHEIAEQISRGTKLHPYSVPKSPTVQGTFRRLIGRKSMLSEEGETWKHLRKRFSPSFSPTHLLNLLPQILSKTAIFTSKLDSYAATGETFSLEDACTRITFDIIGSITMNQDFGAQEEDYNNPNSGGNGGGNGGSNGGREIVQHFLLLASTYQKRRRAWYALPLLNLVQKRIESYRVDAAIKRVIRSTFSTIKSAQNNANTNAKAKNRSVLALSLQDTDILTREILQTTADQMKTFLFAGHDTTSTLLQRLFYALSLHPACLRKLRAEHDSVFGEQEPGDVFIAQPEDTMKALTYTSACIKETLRLWPPAATARMADEGAGFGVKMRDGEVVVDGCVLYNCQYLIQRDLKVYGETRKEFCPERWLGYVSTSAENEDRDGAILLGNREGSNKIPISAWRTFERGPRNCIGQELANIEARVILASVVRRFDFVKVGAGEVEVDEEGVPVLDEKGVYKTKSELFSAQIVTAKPFDGCQMRVKLHV